MNSGFRLPMSNLNPTARTDLHGAFRNFLTVVSSAIGSLLFVWTVSLGANIYHLRDKFSGRERQNRPKKDNAVPNYTPVEPYPNVDKMKITKDLAYYAQLLDLDLEIRYVTTRDGHILPLHRLIDPKDSEEVRQAKKPLLLQHGLLLCAGAWLAPGRNSLPYYFVQQGFDVWLGNNRCGFEPKHETLKGNLMHTEEFWDWDVRHLAFYDLPCFIDNILAHKPLHHKLLLAGHLQGCTQTMILLRNPALKEYRAKIEYFFALAPAIFPGKLFHERSFIKFIHSKSPGMYNAIFGNCCFLAFLGQMRKWLGTTSIFSLLSYQIFKYLFGWNIRNCYKHKKVIHIQFLFNATFVSARLMSWWLSYSVPEGFLNQLLPKTAYQDGSNAEFTPVNSAAPEEKVSAEQDLEKNLAEVEPNESETFFPYKKEWFTETAINDLVPMMLFIGGEDYLVDGSRFSSHMRHYEHNYYKEGRNLDIIDLHDYNHLDVIWSLNCIGRIGMVISEKLKAVETAQRFMKRSSKSLSKPTAAVPVPVAA